MPSGSSQLKRMWKIYSNSKEAKICLCGICWRKLSRSSHTLAGFGTLWVSGVRKVLLWAVKCLSSVLVSLVLSAREFYPSERVHVKLEHRCLFIPYFGKLNSLSRYWKLVVFRMAMGCNNLTGRQGRVTWKWIWVYFWPTQLAEVGMVWGVKIVKEL